MGPKRKVSTSASPIDFAPRKIRIQKKKEQNAQQQVRLQKEQQEAEKRQIWFSKYADPEDPDLIRPDGCQRFLLDLNISLESIIPFIIGWKMNSTEMGYLKKDNWCTALTMINVSDEEQLRDTLKIWERSVMEDPDQFKQLYLFTFAYVKSASQKSMDVESAIAIWHVMLETKYPIIKSFIRFIEEAKPVKVINKDQWSSLLDFCKAVPENLQDYDETSSWPVLFDDYVEWRKSL